MQQFLGVIILGLLSGCVTQNYADENKPIVQNEASNNEIAMTRVSLGLGYLKMGNTSQAKQNLEKAKYYAPKLIEVHTAFAHYYEFVGEPELAIAAYQDALAINGADANTLNNFGVFLCRQGRASEAEAQWLKAVAVPSYTQVSESYENLANCQLQQDHFVKAETYLTKAIAHSPSNASSLLLMAKLQYAKSQYQQAEQYIARYEKATRRFDAEALATAFKVYQQQGNHKVAQNYAAMLLKMFPQSFQAKQYLLNELADTDADKLANRYRQFLQGDMAQQLIEPSPSKRVVKLSPKRSENSAQMPEQSVNVTPDENVVDTALPSAQPALVTQAPTVNKTDKIELANDSQDIAATAESITVVAVPEVKKTTNNSKPKVSSKLADNGQTMMTLPVHIVQRGDSLFSISKKYNIRFSSLLAWNDKTQSSMLHIGDVIYLTNPKKAVHK